MRSVFKTYPALLAALCVLPALAPHPTHAQDWPRHRGPNGSGLSEAELPAEITGDTTLWKVPTPGLGHSSMVFWGDLLFTTGQPDPAKSELVLTCLDAATGEGKWEKALPFEPFHVNKKFNTHASSTPAADADHVYLVGASGQRITVQAFTHSGEPAWETSWAGFDDTDHGMIPSPTVLDDLLIVPAEHIGSGGKIAALNRKTGDIVWEVARENAKDSYSTPAIHEQENGVKQIITLSTTAGFTALNAEDGSLVWEYNPGYGQRSVGSPIIANGILFGSLGAGSGAKESAAIIPGTLDRKPEVLYEINKGLPYVPSALVIDGLMYFLNDAGMLSCLDQKSGEMHYDRERLSEGGSVKWFSSPVAAGGKIFACSQGGEVVCVAAGKEFDVLATSTLNGPVNAAPAISGGRLYIRTAESLYCIGNR